MGSALSFTGLALLDGRLKVPHSVQDWGLLMGISTVASVIPVVLLFLGLRRVSTPQAAILSTLEPVFAILLGVMVLGERLSAMQLAGGVLVLLAVVLLQRK